MVLKKRLFKTKNSHVIIHLSHNLHLALQKKYVLLFIRVKKHRALEFIKEKIRGALKFVGINIQNEKPIGH